jgi:hypothetical protein
MTKGLNDIADNLKNFGGLSSHDGGGDALVAFFGMAMGRRRHVSAFRLPLSALV